MGSLRLLRPHHFQQLSKQRQDIGPTIQLSCPSMPFLYPEAGESGPIARAQAVSTPNVLCQPSSGTPDSSFHTTNSPAHPPRAHKLRFFDVRGPEYGPYSPWRFRLVDQQPASGLLDLGILVPSSAILPLAMLEPKYSMVPRLLCSLCALSVSPNRSPCSNYPAQLRIVMVLDQNSPTACMERRPVVFTVPLERRLKKIWGLLHEIQPRTALSKPMRRPEDT